MTTKDSSIPGQPKRTASGSFAGDEVGNGKGPDYVILLVFMSYRLDRFVLARHRDRGWELPGGRVEPGEGFAAAARREWAEETGLGLAHLEPLLLHERPDGSRGHVFLGAVTASREPGLEVTGVVKQVADPRERIDEVRGFARLVEARPLAFPDDPYDTLARAAWARAVSGPFVAGAHEDEASFVARLGVHPEVRLPGHRVTRHPLAVD